MFIRGWMRCTLSYKWNSRIRECFSSDEALRRARDWVWFGTLVPWDKRKDYFTLTTVGEWAPEDLHCFKRQFQWNCQVVKHLINHAQTNLALQPSLLLLVMKPVVLKGLSVTQVSLSVISLGNSLHAALELDDCLRWMRVHIHSFPYKCQPKCSQWCRTCQ